MSVTTSETVILVGADVRYCKRENENVVFTEVGLLGGDRVEVEEHEVESE